MEDLYWITRFDAIHGVSMAFAIVLGIIMIVCFFLRLDGTTRTKSTDITFWTTLPLTVIFIFVTVLIPTTQEALLIYGLGGTIDYMKDNDTTKKLPDKAIIALDKYLDSLNEDKENKDK